MASPFRAGDRKARGSLLRHQQPNPTATTSVQKSRWICLLPQLTGKARTLVWMRAPRWPSLPRHERLMRRPNRAACLPARCPVCGNDCGHSPAQTLRPPSRQPNLPIRREVTRVRTRCRTMQPHPAAASGFRSRCRTPVSQAKDGSVRRKRFTRLTTLPIRFRRSIPGSFKQSRPSSQFSPRPTRGRRSHEMFLPPGRLTAVISNNGPTARKPARFLTRRTGTAVMRTSTRFRSTSTTPQWPK